jgi:threonyl-tRNA synthetase
MRDRIEGDLGSLPLAGAIEKLAEEVHSKRVRQVVKSMATLSDHGTGHEY